MKCKYEKDCNYLMFGEHCQYKEPFTRCPQWVKFRYGEWLEDRIKQTSPPTLKEFKSIDDKNNGGNN